MPDAYILTQKEVELLSETVRIVNKLIANTFIRDDQGDFALRAPDCYVAVAPVGGIPAFVPRNYLGVAYCQIYQVVDGVPPQLQLLNRYTEKVHNLGEELEEGTWVLIQREKSGRWMVKQAVVAGRRIAEGMWVELLDRRLDKAAYAFREAVWDEMQNTMVPKPGGFTGDLDANPAWDASLQFGIPVPRTYVRMVEEVAYTGTGAEGGLTGTFE